MKYFDFKIYVSRQIIKFIIIMNKKFLKVAYEVLKALVYALGGFFGGNAIM